MNSRELEDYFPGARARLLELQGMSDDELAQLWPDYPDMLKKAQEQHVAKTQTEILKLMAGRLQEIVLKMKAVNQARDLEDIRREAAHNLLVEMRAFEIFQDRAVTGRGGSREADWIQAAEDVASGQFFLKSFDRAAFLERIFMQRLRDEAVNIYNNLIHLGKDEFALIQPRVIHAIVHGRYGEIQTASDNTLRAANTDKPLDVPNLMQITNFKTGKPRTYRLPPRERERPWVNNEASFKMEDETDRFEVKTVWFPTRGSMHEGGGEGFEMLVCLKGKFSITSEGMIESQLLEEGSSIMTHPLMGKYTIISHERDTEIIKLNVPYARKPQRQVEAGVVKELVEDLERVNREHGLRIVTLCDNEVIGGLQQAGFDWWGKLLSFSKLVTMDRHIVSDTDIESTMDGIESYNPDRIVVIGSSTSIDNGEYIASQLGIPVIFVPTVLTTNTMYGYKAHLAVGPEKVPVTVVTPLPTKVVVDLELLEHFIQSKAIRSEEGIDSKRANRSGMGDLVCLDTALWDWNRAVREGRQVMVEWIFAQHTKALRDIRDSAAHIRSVDREGLRLIERLLYETSWNSIVFGNSQPQSGSEHILSDSITQVLRERKDLHPVYLHGEKIAIATLVMAYLQSLEQTGKEDSARGRAMGLRRLIKNLGIPTTPEELKIPREVIVEALMRARPRVDKYTWFDTDFAKTLDREMIERVVDIVFGEEGLEPEEGGVTADSDALPEAPPSEAPAKGPEHTSPSGQGIPPVVHETPKAAIASVEESVRQASIHLTLSQEGAINLSHIAIIMKRDLPESISIGKKDTLLSETLRGQYQVMKQHLRKTFSGEQGVVEVANQHELTAQMNALIGQGLKVIVLDNGTLTQGIDTSAIQGKAGENYCIVSADSAEDLDATTIQFVNLNAMALMGVGILYNDITLFQVAYRAFTGHEVPEDVMSDLARKALWIIRALPRIVRFTNELRDQGILRKLFAVSA